MQYAELKARILRTLQAEEGGNYSNELLHDAILGALDASMPWVARKAVETIIGDGEETTFELPDDFYRLDGIQDVGNGKFSDQMLLASGGKPPASGSALTWIEYPSGSILFSEAPDSDNEIRVFYSAYYNRPAGTADVTFVMPIPRAAEVGVMYWAAAYCLVPPSTGASETRTYNLKIDSGRPTDNVLEQSAKFLRSLFLEEMNRIGKRQSGGA